MPIEIIEQEYFVCDKCGKYSDYFDPGWSKKFCEQNGWKIVWDGLNMTVLCPECAKKQ